MTRRIGRATVFDSATEAAELLYQRGVRAIFERSDGTVIFGEPEDLGIVDRDDWTELSERELLNYAATFSAEVFTP